ncbi:hypothetical protein PVAG01_09555 [Phlyctema vagabunda]|uniref:F-box domain-containing protein n=1 Tax=Phlyctema vagabunda TaxID=108571 RepID=A0ABR4P7Q9_9HELO
MAFSSLESLSPELLAHIISFIPHSWLSSVALVSRSLNQIATPELYATVDFAINYDEELITYLRPFAFLVLQKPSLASLVHSLSIRDEWTTEDSDTPDSDTLKIWPDHTDLDQIVRKAVEHVEGSKEEADKLFASARWHRNEGAILSILLPQLKKLQRLDLGHGELGGGEYILRMLARDWTREVPSGTEPPFAQLTDVMVAGYEDKYPCEPDVFGACLNLPALKNLYGYLMGSNEQSEVTAALKALRPASSSVELIELRRSQLFMEDLECVLKACKGLKTFIYEVGVAWAWTDLKMADVLESMLTQKHSLEHLSLTGAEIMGVDEPDEFKPMSFAAFEKLTYLKVESLFLGGSDDWKECSLTATFPPTLRTLHVTGCCENFYCGETMNALQEVLEKKEQYLPQLDTLILEGEFTDVKEQVEGMIGVIRAGESLDIDFTVVSVKEARGDDPKQYPGWGRDGSVEWKVISNEGSAPIREVLDIQTLY